MPGTLRPQRSRPTSDREPDRNVANLERVLVCLLLLGTVVALALPADAQWGRRSRWNVPSPPEAHEFPSQQFTFCTIQYEQVRNEDLGFGWSTDFPDAGENFMERLEELTNIRVSRKPNGRPDQVVLKLTDDALFNYPYIFMSDVGTAYFNDEEKERLREYLLRGGLLHVDDFWGTAAWNHWEALISDVLPPDEYKIREVPLSDDIFHIVFHVTEVPQVPSIQWWQRVQRDSSITSERGPDSRIPHLRGIRHPVTNKLMVIMTYNTDLADGWEKERENKEYFEEFSVKKSYPLGVNIVVYAMTH